MARSEITGHVWQVQWSNAHTEPLAGMPRILAEMFVPCEPGQGAGRCPQQIEAYQRPPGYGIYCAALAPPLRPLSPDRLATLRRRRLERREKEKHPLFADRFIAESLAAKPDYYAGTDCHSARDAVLVAEQERYEYLMARPNRLLVYWQEEVF